MDRLLFLIAFCVFLSGCVDKPKNTHTIKFSASVEDRELNSSEYEDEFKISYLTTLNSDTIEVFPSNGYLELPEYDSTFVYFGITFKNYSCDFGGDMLTMEVPNMLSKKLTYWDFKLDKPPFMADYSNRKDKDRIEAVGYVRHDLGDWLWLSIKEE